MNAAARPPILLDARGLQPGFKQHRGRGIGTYLASLIAALANRPEAADLGLAVDPGLPAPPAAERGGFRLAPLTGAAGPARLYQPLRTELLFRGLVDDGRPGAPVLVHFASHLDAPAWTPLRFTATVHDLIPRLLPERLPPLRAAAARLRDAREVRILGRARAILVDSEAVRGDVARLFPAAAGKVTVVPLGVDRRFFERASAGRVEALRARLALPEPYLLQVGGIDRSKNAPFLLRVLAALAERRRAGEAAPVLALPGALARHRGWPAFAREIANASLEPAVRVLGFVPDEDMPALYRGALCLLCPSLHEGFGLPALEAMAAGTPALVSDRGALREIAGGGAMTLDPTDAPAWADAIRALASSPARRTELAARGAEWVTRYSWDATARATFAALERAARGA